MESLSCSSICKDVRNPIKLSGGCSTERYLMRQRYLRSYPLMMAKKEERLEGNNVAKRANKWLKEMQRKSYFRFNDRGENKKTWWRRRRWWPAAGHEKSGPNPADSSSSVEACLNLLLACMAKVDVTKLENPKPTDFGAKKL